jgi:surface polysaccharide O-acyltransferase-like enzyme
LGIRKFILCGSTSLKLLLGGIFNFNTNGYSWYVNMYIGLYIIIPFLNIIIKEISENKNTFIFAVLVLTCLTAIPYCFDYWTIIYPINYYFIGTYIKEYSLEIKKYKCVILIMIILLLEVMVLKLIGFSVGVFNKLWNVNISNEVCFDIFIIKFDKIKKNYNYFRSNK